MDDLLLDDAALASLTALIWVSVIGAGLGLGLRYLLPHRHTYGLLLLPAIGAAAAALTWVIMLWVGVDESWGWVAWVATFLAAIAIPAIVALALGGSRTAADTRRRHALTAGRV